MNRSSMMIMASRRAIRLTFSHGQMRNSPAPISRFFGSDSQKTLHSWQKDPNTDISVDDEFDELGPAVTSLPESSFRSSQEVPQNERKSFGTPLSYGNGKMSMMNDQGEDGDVGEGSGSADLVSVVIDNVPVGVNDGQLKDVVCEFGDVKAICVSAQYNGLNSYRVEFKDRESREKALDSGEVTIGSYTLTINRTKTPRLLSIRTNKVDTELAMHNMLSSYGYMKGLISRNDGAVDVFFQVDDEIEAERLINKLDKKLVQEVKLQKLKAVNTTCEKSELNFERKLAEIRKQQELRMIYLEDLEHLHSAISHIKAYP